jgi:glycosyltransferase involved in cell wall biosynthesis
MKDKLRVLHVVGEMNSGGIESMIMNLYRAIDRDLVQFDFLLHTDQECRFSDEIRQLGGNIFHVPRFLGVNFFQYRKAVKQFFFQHHGFDIIHGHIGSTAAIYLKAAKSYGIATIAHSHNAAFDPGIKGTAYRFFSFPTRYIADHLLGCSTAAGIARYGKRAVSSHKYHTFNNGINSAQYIYSETARKRIRSDFDLGQSPVLITVGRLTEQKNPAGIIAIMEALHKVSADTRLIWVGDGELFPTIKESIIGHGLRNVIIMTGARQDVPDLLSAADAFILPSLFEGLPVSVIEAVASDLPCYISDTITKEVCISPQVHQLPITKPFNSWVAALSVLKLKTREDRSELIASVGYDISKTTEWLTEFYGGLASHRSK